MRDISDLTPDGIEESRDEARANAKKYGDYAAEYARKADLGNASRYALDAEKEEGIAEVCEAILSALAYDVVCELPVPEDTDPEKYRVMAAMAVVLKHNGFYASRKDAAGTAAIIGAVSYRLDEFGRAMTAVIEAMTEREQAKTERERNASAIRYGEREQGGKKFTYQKGKAAAVEVLNDLGIIESRYEPDRTYATVEAGSGGRHGAPWVDVTISTHDPVPEGYHQEDEYEGLESYGDEWRALDAENERLSAEQAVATYHERIVPVSKALYDLGYKVSTVTLDKRLARHSSQNGDAEYELRIRGFVHEDDDGTPVLLEDGSYHRRRGDSPIMAAQGIVSEDEED